MIDLLCLLEFYNTYSHDDIYYEIAGKMIQDFDLIRDMGAQELADHLFISSSTLYRFIKMMSYDSHKEMKRLQQIFLEGYTGNGRYFPKETDGCNSLKSQGDYLCRSIQELLSSIQEQSLAEMEDAIFEAEQIIFVGIPMPSVVWRLQVELTLLGKKTSAFLNPQYQIDEIVASTGNALVFIIHNTIEEAPFYQEALEKAKKNQILVAVISSLPISPLLSQADYCICFEGDMSENDMLLFTFLLHSLGERLYQKVLQQRHKNLKKGNLSE